MRQVESWLYVQLYLHAMPVGTALRDVVVLTRYACCRYQQFKGALEKLDSKLAGNSSLPIVYQWEHQMTGPVLK